MWPFPPALVFYKSQVLYTLYPRKSQTRVEKDLFPSSGRVLLVYGGVCALTGEPRKE